MLVLLIYFFLQQACDLFIVHVENFLSLKFNKTMELRWRSASFLSPSLEIKIWANFNNKEKTWKLKHF